VVYFSHGGGPLPILGEPGHKAMVEFMRHLPSQLHRPDAIVVISAHWEERQAHCLERLTHLCFMTIMASRKRLIRLIIQALEIRN
jgi:aromatic ring-opening dioxygenase catalytic subunit (LigB family)